MQAGPDGVRRRGEQLGRDAVGQQSERRRVRRDQVPAAVHDQRRVRRVPGEHLVERGAHGRHGLGVERRLAVGGRVARGQQQRVALAQRDVEVLGEVEHQLAARPRAARLHEAQVPRRDGGVERDLQLAQPAAAPPVAEQLPDRRQRRMTRRPSPPTIQRGVRDNGGVSRRVTSSTFVGRGAELDVLGGALDRAADGRPAFVFVGGESGVGKTRLLREFESRARRERRARAARPVPRARRRPDRLRAARRRPAAARARPRGRGGRDAAAVRPQRARRAAARAGRHGLARRRGGRARARAACSRRCSRCSSGSAARARCCWRSRTCTGPTAPRATSSPSSCAARARSRSASSSPTAPTSCTGATRCARSWPSSSAPPASTGSRWSASTATRSPSSSRASYQEPAPADLAERLYARSQGNPLYTEELLAALEEGDSWLLPETLRDVLLARIERLSAPAQAIVRIAAVLDRPATHALLEAVSDLAARRRSWRARARPSPIRCW